MVKILLIVFDVNAFSVFYTVGKHQPLHYRHKIYAYLLQHKYQFLVICGMIFKKPFAIVGSIHFLGEMEDKWL